MALASEIFKKGTADVVGRSHANGLGEREKAYKRGDAWGSKSQGNLAVAGVVLAGPLAGVIIKGEEADIPAGTRLTFRTKEDIILEANITENTK